MTTKCAELMILTARRPISPSDQTDPSRGHQAIASAISHETSSLLSPDAESERIESISETPGSPQNTEKSLSTKRNRTSFQRIDTLTLVMASFSLIFLLAPLSFLGWMWFGDRSSSTWRRIMVDDFAKQAVTISAIVLRTALATLGGIATAMIASISIERRGIPFKDVAQVSLARFSNSGPDAFWVSMLFRRTFIEYPLRLLLMLLLLFTLASQFTSTILLSDLGQGTVITPAVTSTNTSGFSFVDAGFDIITDQLENPNSPFETSPNYWTTDPTVFQTFAEHSELGSSSDGVEDTGLTLRALLPFGDANARETIRDFEGMAPVFDARIVCTRPQLTDLILDPANPSVLSLMGNYTANPSLPGLAATQPVVPFNCPLMIPFVPLNGSFSTRDPSNYWSICPLNASAGGLLPVLDPANNASLTLEYNDGASTSNDAAKINSKGGIWHITDGGWDVDIGNAYLIHNGADIDPNLDLGFSNINGTFNWSSVAEDGPWVKVNFQGSVKDASSNPDTSPTCPSDECYKVKFRMSLCYDAL